MGDLHSSAPRCFFGRLSSLLVCVSILLSLASCVVGPDYESPDLTEQMGAKWHVSEDASEASVEDLSAWWRELEDPELTSLVERALAQNLDLEEARERIIAARARRGIENAAALPTLDALASYQRVATGKEGLAFAGAPAGASTNVWGQGISAGWEIDLFGRIQRLTEAADAEIEFAAEDLRAIRVALAADVARQVVTLRALDGEIARVQSSIDSDRDVLAIASSRVRAGFGDALDVSRAQRVLESNLAVLTELQGRRKESELNLSSLLAAVPGSIEVSSSLTPRMPRRNVLPAMGLPADLLTRRPDIRRADRDYAAATARIGAAEAERYPQLSISGALQLQGVDVGDLVNPDAYVLNLGPSFTLPLLDGGRIDNNVTLAESLQRQKLTALRRVVLAALTEVEVAASQRRQSERRVQVLLSARKAASETEALAQDRFQAGAVDFLDVTEARTRRLSIERDLVLAERDALFRLIDLYAALGGGWDLNTTDFRRLPDTAQQD